MRPIYQTIQIVNAITGIATDQIVVAGAAFDIDGTLNVDNVAFLTLGLTGINVEAMQVTAETDANITVATLTVTGTDTQGNVITSTIVAPTLGDPIITTPEFFATVTSVVVADDTVTGVTIGWHAEQGDVVTAPLPINWRQGPANVTLSMSPSPISSATSGATATMQYSLDDPRDTANFPSYNNDATWRSPDPLVAAPPDPLGLVVSTDTRLEGPTRAIRGVIQATLGATNQRWRFTVIQGDNI